MATKDLDFRDLASSPQSRFRSWLQRNLYDFIQDYQFDGAIHASIGFAFLRSPGPNGRAGDHLVFPNFHS